MTGAPTIWFTNKVWSTQQSDRACLLRLVIQISVRPIEIDGKASWMTSILTTAKTANRVIIIWISFRLNCG